MPGANPRFQKRRGGGGGGRGLHTSKLGCCPLKANSTSVWGGGGGGVADSTSEGGGGCCLLWANSTSAGEGGGGLLFTLGQFNQWEGGLDQFNPGGGCYPLTALSIFKKGKGALYLHGYIGNHITSCTL